MDHVIFGAFSSIALIIWSTPSDSPIDPPDFRVRHGGDTDAVEDAVEKLLTDVTPKTGGNGGG